MCSVFVLDEVYVEKADLHRQVELQKQAIFKAAHSTVLILVHKAPKVWCTLMSFEVGVILQC